MRFLLAVITVLSVDVWSVNASTTVISVFPALNSENVSVSTTLTITFSNDIDAGTVSGSTVNIIGALIGYYSFTSSYSSATKTLTLTPNHPFKYGERIQVVLTNSILDASTNPIQPYSFGFTTKNVGGLGTFTQSSVAPVGNTPEGIGMTDLDGDGDPDFIVANYYSSSVSFFENNGSGILTVRATMTIGSLPQAVPMGIGDFDRDGDNDVIVPCRGSGYLAYLKNNNNWTFTLSTIATGGSPLGVTAGDIDRDGDLDLVAPNQSDVRIFMNNGTGAFVLSSVLSPGGNPHSPTLADIDGDGDLDLAVVRYFATSVTVYLNNGNGSFTYSNTYTVGSQPRTAEYADFDMDGDVDFVVSNSLNNTVTMLKNNGNGIFTTSTIFAGNIPHTASPIDVEGDGDADILISNGLILINDGTGVFTPLGSSSSHEYPVVGDFDGDGDADIARVSNTQHVIRVLLNNNSNRPPVADAGSSSIFECSSTSGATAFLDGHGSYDPDGDEIEFTWKIGTNVIAGPTSSNTATVSLPLGVYLITLVVKDEHGAVANDEVTITVQDKTSPQISTPSPLEFVNDPGYCGRTGQNVVLIPPTVSDVCSDNVTLTNNAPYTYPVGATIVTWTADDGNGNTAEVQQTIRVIDQESPSISVTVSPSILWPPNHKMVTIQANVQIADNCQASYSLVSISSNEPDNGLGDGDETMDIQNAEIGTADNTFKLRSERSGVGTGRIYTITYRAKDESGNVSFATAIVSVPHSAPKGGLETNATPEALIVEQNHPNPFSGRTQIRYHMPTAGVVRIEISDVLGRRNIVAFEGIREAGVFDQMIDLNEYPEGIYVCRIEMRSVTSIIPKVMERRMVLIR